ncbi:GNAT family N-acetyltransferase [Cellulomonas sp. Marseille-Q8402]
MSSDGSLVLRADDPRVAVHVAAGWTVVARSWGARLDADAADHGLLRSSAARPADHGSARALRPDDRDAVLALDAATAGDYPGGVATAHTPLDAERATVGPGRCGVGFVTGAGEIVAMTFVDLDLPHAEVDFTVVAPTHRGLGIATAVKAASVLGLLDRGVTTVRTGGSAENAAILAANRAVGFVVDEEWLTLDPP